METNEMIAFCKERIPNRDWDNSELQIWSREFITYGVKPLASAMGI